MTGWLAAQKRAAVARRKTEYQDRGVGTMLDGYSSAELDRLMGDLLGQERQPAKFLRTRLDFLLGHLLVTRGENRRWLDLADLCSVDFELQEGPTRCICLVATFGQGKTFKGRLEFMGAIRHRDARRCLLGALAQYLFFRFQCTDEGFPDFSTRESWYDTKVILGKDPQAEISYDTQYEWIKQLFARQSITSRKITHAMRGSAVRDADSHGVLEGEVCIPSFIPVDLSSESNTFGRYPELASGTGPPWFRRT